LPAAIVVASHFVATIKIVTAQKPLIHRHLCMASRFAQKNARAENFLPRRSASAAAAHRLRTPVGAVTHKI
jgi:hypothetical protein